MLNPGHTCGDSAPVFCRYIVSNNIIMCWISLQLPTGECPGPVRWWISATPGDLHPFFLLSMYGFWHVESSRLTASLWNQSLRLSDYHLPVPRRGVGGRTPVSKPNTIFSTLDAPTAQSTPVGNSSPLISLDSSSSSSFLYVSLDSSDQPHPTPSHNIPHVVCKKPGGLPSAEALGRNRSLSDGNIKQ